MGRKQEKLPGYPEGGAPQPADTQAGEKRSISLTLTANAGLLADCGGEKLLVDGLNDPTGLPFSRVPEEILTALLEGTGIWSGIRWMAFTHLHPDHFSELTLKRFLMQNPIKGLFLPLGGAAGGNLIQPGLRECLSKQKIPVSDLSRLGNGAECFPLSETVKLTAFRVSHAGEEYHKIDHFAFLLEADRKRVLFLGDAEYDGEALQPLLSGLQLDAAVVNPMFLILPKGRRAAAALQPKRLIVAHLPFEQDDGIGLRKLTARCLERYGEQLPPATVLWEPMAQVKL